MLSVSDAAYVAQPAGSSQGGLLVALAHPDIKNGMADLVVIEGISSKLQRVVRCSMAAEMSQATTAYEHGDYIRAVHSEILCPKFNVRSWKFFSSRWQYFLVFDVKVAYDALQSDNVPIDRKLIVDITILREAL